jgi:hypothetical protein
MALPEMEQKLNGGSLQNVQITELRTERTPRVHKKSAPVPFLISCRS